MSLAIKKNKLASPIPVKHSLKSLEKNQSNVEQIQNKTEESPESQQEATKLELQGPVKLNSKQEFFLKNTKTNEQQVKSVQEPIKANKNDFQNEFDWKGTNQLSVSETNLSKYKRQNGAQVEEKVLLQLGLARNVRSQQKVCAEVAESGQKEKNAQLSPNNEFLAKHEVSLRANPVKLRVLSSHRNGSSSDLDIIKKEEIKQKLNWKQPNQSKKCEESRDNPEWANLEEKLGESQKKKPEKVEENVEKKSQSESARDEPDEKTKPNAPDKDLQNVYDSIGKIKAFVQNSSVIELKPVNSEKREEVPSQKETGQLYRSEEGGKMTEVMHRIRRMAKDLKRNRHRKKKSLGLKELSQEIDDIIGQIDKIQKGGTKNRRKTSGKSRKSESPHAENQQKQNIWHSPQISSKLQRKRVDPYSSYLVNRRLEEEPDPHLLRPYNSRQLRKFKSAVRSRERVQAKGTGKSPPELNRMQLTSDLNDICKTIDDLEQQELGNTYHRHRQEKLKNLMRSSKLADMRRTMSNQQNSEGWQAQSETESNEHLDQKFTMKKCFRCTLYFPQEKIFFHYQNCSK